jgi:hypothetical protein
MLMRVLGKLSKLFLYDLFDLMGGQGLDTLICPFLVLVDQV